jgi:hypothetical protein
MVKDQENGVDEIRLRELKGKLGKSKEDEGGVMANEALPQTK